MGDEESDEEYEPGLDQEDNAAVWDEDENIRSAPLQDISVDAEELEEEQEEPSLPKETQAHKSETSSVNAEDILGVQR